MTQAVGSPSDPATCQTAYAMPRQSPGIRASPRATATPPPGPRWPRACPPVQSQSRQWLNDSELFSRVGQSPSCHHPAPRLTVARHRPPGTQDHQDHQDPPPPPPLPPPTPPPLPPPELEEGSRLAVAAAAGRCDTDVGR